MMKWSSAKCYIHEGCRVGTSTCTPALRAQCAVFLCSELTQLFPCVAHHQVSVSVAQLRCLQIPLLRLLESPRYFPEVVIWF